MTPRQRSKPDKQEPIEKLARTGVAGLDEVLLGGLSPNHVYLVDGEPGTGKTTLALQFLAEGVAHGERGLYVALSESAAELRAIARSHDWTLEGIEIHELGGMAASFGDADYTIFHPSEIELQETMDHLFSVIDRFKPQRAVFDSLSEMRLLARDPLRFRRQILSLKQFFSNKPCTVMLLDDKTAPGQDLQLHSLAHGVIALEHIALEYGAERRRLQVRKIRGKQFRGGYHDFRILTGGITVFPRITNVGSNEAHATDLHHSGSRELDALLGGGLTRGTSALLHGAAGTGKSILATQYAMNAVAAGERVKFYLFDERVGTFLLRAEGLGMRLDPALRDGRLQLQQIEPTELSPGEFAHQVVSSVERDGTTMVVIDSINGYMQSMPEERLLPVHVHEMLTYLSNKRVTSIMTLVQRGVFGNPVDDAADVSYLADTVILLRYFEVQGEVRQAISVVKKRSGNHERTIRECRVGRGGLRVGEPLSEFRGVLTGVPHYIGESPPNIRDSGKRAASRNDDGTR